MRRVAAVLLAGALLVGTTGCGKSEQWQKDKAECIESWKGYKGPEEIDAKCTKDADYWEANGHPNRK